MKIPIFEKIVLSEVERRLSEIERNRRIEDHMRDIEERARDHRMKTDERFARYEKDIKTYVAAETAKLENQINSLTIALQNVAAACQAYEQVKCFFENAEKKKE